MKYTALIGNPVEHSISPLLFSILMNKYNIEYQHNKIKVSKKEDLLKVINELFDNYYSGINITCPYKKDIYSLVDVYEDGSEKIYSINTIYKKNNKIYGCNTDGKAAIMSIEREYCLTNKSKVVMFGAGGVAYSIFYELLNYTKNIIVIDRNINDATTLINHFNSKCKAYDLENTNEYINDLINADLIINATSVGMNPNNDSILSENIIELLPNKKVYFDVVFNPWNTKFLQLAKKYNNTTISGGYMLIYQGCLALSKWMNINIELSEEEIYNIKNILKKELNNKND